MNHLLFKKATIYAGLTILLPAIVSFGTLKILIITLGDREFANYSLLLVFISIPNTLITSPYINYLKSISFEQSNVENNRSISNILSVVAILNVLIIFALNFCNSTYAYSVYFTIFLCSYSVAFTVQQYVSFFYNKLSNYKKLLLVSVLPSIISLLLTASTILTGVKSIWLLYAFTLGGYLVAFYFLPKIHQWQHVNPGSIYHTLKTSISYIFPLFIYSVLVWFNQSFGRLLLNQYHQSSEVALFAAFQSVSMKLFSVITSTIIIRFTSQIFQTNKSEINSVLYLYLRIYLVCAILLLSSLMWFPDFFIFLLLKNNYSSQKPLFYLMSVSYLLSGIVSLIEQKFYLNKQTGVILCNYILGNLVTYILAYHWLNDGAMGIALSYSCGFLVMCGFLSINIYVWKERQV